MKFFGVAGTIIALTLACELLLQPGSGPFVLGAIAVVIVPIWFLRAITRGHPTDRSASDDWEQTDEYTRQSHFSEDDYPSLESDNRGSHWDDDSTATSYGVDDHDPGFNPATGLPMTGGGVDIAGNPYGTDLSHDDWLDSSHHSHDSSMWDD